MKTVKHKDFEKAKVQAKSCADIFGKFFFSNEFDGVIILK